MSNGYDRRDYRRSSGRDDSFHSSSNYRNGITSYERGSGMHTRGAHNSNPYRRSNMIYARKRRRWPFVLIALAVIAALVGIAVFACSGNAGEGQQQEQAGQQEADSGTQGQQGTDEQESSEQQPDATSADAGSEDRRKAVSDSRNDVKPDHKVVYLTFDDGPSPNTHKILDILEKNDVKATWFVIGVSGHLDYVTDIWNAGHQLALHTNSHDYAKVYKDTDAFWDEMESIGKKVKKYVGFAPTLIRFPGGSVNDYNTSISKTLRQQSYKKGYHYFDWNVSSTDASGNNVPASKILKAIKKESKGCNSCCVLMHDTEAKGTTVEALPDIIAYYKKKGFEFDVLTADSFGYHFQNDK